MAKIKSVFYCTACGGETAKWQGRCPACGEWNTIEEHIEKPTLEEVETADRAARERVRFLAGAN